MKHTAPGVKRSVYLREADAAEIDAEAYRLRRPRSWVVVEAWRIAKDVLRQLPEVKR